MKLYEINDELRKLWDKIAEQDGEMLEEDIKALDELALAKDEKIKGYGILIRELSGEIADCAAEIKRIENISEKKENRLKWLKERLTAFMQEQDIPKFESIEVNISFKKSYPLRGAEQAYIDGKLPKEFIKQTITEKPDKTAIKDFIKNGGTVEGCYIGEEHNIQVK